MNLQDKNQEATVYIGNLDERIDESLLWELMCQAGPVASVYIPKDRVTQIHQGYGFCEFATEQDADYAVKIMNMVKVFGKPIRVNKATADKRTMDVGAILFVGNLSAEVDEQMLFDTFSAFGAMVEAPRIQRDDSGVSRGFGFVNFDSFETADAALDAMNGQWLANRQISVTYAFKKDGRGERHGSEAERLLAKQGKQHVQPPSAPAPLQSVPHPSAQGGYMMPPQAAYGMYPPSLAVRPGYGY